MRSGEVVMLDTFQKCLDIDQKIGRDKKWGREYYRVQFSNVQFYDWLLRIGLFPAKSYTIGAIDVPDKFFRDYFRGCVDGDGNIRTYANNYNVYRGRRYTTQCLFIRIVSASERHIIWLREKIKNLTGLHGAVLIRPPKKESYSPLWTLQFAKRESVKLIDWMYYSRDIPCLERKRAIAQDAITIIGQQKRREYKWID